MSLISPDVLIKYIWRKRWSISPWRTAQNSGEGNRVASLEYRQLDIFVGHMAKLRFSFTFVAEHCSRFGQQLVFGKLFFRANLRWDFQGCCLWTPYSHFSVFPQIFLFWQPTLPASNQRCAPLTECTETETFLCIFMPKMKARKGTPLDVLMFNYRRQNSGRSKGRQNRYIIILLPFL